MSVPVGLDALREQIAVAGGDVFLISVREGPRPHVVSTRPEWDGDELVVPAGARTAEGVARHPDVTLLWPSSGHDYALIVDGTARGEGDVVRISPTRAVLHRSALAPPASGHGEGDDPRCVPVIG